MNKDSKKSLFEQRSKTLGDVFESVGIVGLDANGGCKRSGVSLQEVLSKIHMATGVPPKKLYNGSYSACCPAHDDKNPSLSVREADDGKILFKCHAGCTLEEICSAINITKSDLFPKQEKIFFYPSAENGDTYYPYMDENGSELYRKERVYLDGKKKFFQKRKNEDGSFSFSLDGCRRVLYRLPEVLKCIGEGKTLFLVEGEKDADCLFNLGLVATTASGSLEWCEEYTHTLKDADVVILYDNDKTGLKRRDNLISKLFGKVRRLRVVDLPGIEYSESHGKDITDWLNVGNSVDQLLKLVEKTKDYGFQEKKEDYPPLSFNEILVYEVPEREVILSPFWFTQQLGMIHAKRGVGKTQVALGIAFAVSTGREFLRWSAPKPRKVLYIDGEMSLASMKARLKNIFAAEGGCMPEEGFLKFITPGLYDKPMPDLSTQEGRNAIRDTVKDFELIIVDNISCLFQEGFENEAESWVSAQTWLLNLRREGKSVLLIHHAGKSGRQRGTSKREDSLDFVIKLEHSEGYKSKDGAAFEVCFEKARDFYGEDAESFCAQLISGEDGISRWSFSELPVSPEVEKVAALKNKGMTFKCIGEEMGLTKSQVETRVEKARERGLCK